jgi:hypothetical protein
LRRWRHLRIEPYLGTDRSEVAAVVRLQPDVHRVAAKLLYGTLAVGILDALDAVIFFGLMHGDTPVRVFQGIAGVRPGRSTFS